MRRNGSGATTSRGQRILTGLALVLAAVASFQCYSLSNSKALIEEQLVQSKTQVVDLEDKLSQAKYEEEDLQRKYKTKESDLSRTTSKLEQTESELREAKDEAASKDKELDELSKANEQIHDELKKLQEEEEALDDAKRTCVRDLEAADDSESALKAKLRELEEAHEETKLKHEQLLQQHHVYKDDCERERQERANGAEATSKLSQQLKTCEDKASALEVKLQSAASHVEKQQPPAQVQNDNGFAPPVHEQIGGNPVPPGHDVAEAPKPHADFEDGDAGNHNVQPPGAEHLGDGEHVDEEEGDEVLLNKLQLRPDAEEEIVDKEHEELFPKVGDNEELQWEKKPGVEDAMKDMVEQLNDGMQKKESENNSNDFAKPLPDQVDNAPEADAGEVDNQEGLHFQMDEEDEEEAEVPQADNFGADSEEGAEIDNPFPESPIGGVDEDAGVPGEREEFKEFADEEEGAPNEESLINQRMQEEMDNARDPFEGEEGGHEDLDY